MLTAQTIHISFLVGLAASCFALTWVLTGAFMKYAVAKKRLDVPNGRSMHSRPVPRGGGIAIVVSFSLAVLTLAAVRADMWLLAAALVFAGGLVAGVGWLDDRSHVSPVLRMIVHIICCALAVGFVIDGAWPLAASAPSPDVFRNPAFRPLFPAEWLSAGAAVVLAAYLLNLYNFMDGLDGLAGSEGAFAGIAGGALIVLFSKRGWMFAINGSIPPMYPYHPQAVGLCSLLLGACCLGFLMLNWPPAKIFMGDVGSGFLGFSFAVLIFASAWIDLSLLWMWLILLGTFVADVTYTLAVRVVTGQSWHEAHRLHAFQKLALKCGGHLKVTAAYLAVGVFWLLPLAYLSVTHPRFGPILFAVAYVPLILAAALTRAGMTEPAK